MTPSIKYQGIEIIMIDERPLEEFISYGFKTFLKSKIENFCSQVESNYQNFKSSKKCLQIKLIFHLKEFNQIISNSVFIIFKITNEDHKQNIYEKSANLLYGFYKQFKESKSIQFFNYVQQQYLLLIILIYGSLLIHQANANVPDVKNYKKKIQNHLLAIFVKYINSGYLKSDLSSYIYYQILNQVPLNILSVGFFDQINGILKSFDFRELLEKIYYLKNEFLNFKSDPFIQKKPDINKSYGETKTQNADNKNLKQTKNQIVELQTYKIKTTNLDETKKYIQNFAVKQGFVINNSYQNNLKKPKNKKQAFVLQREDYFKINRNTCEKYYLNESSFQKTQQTNKIFQRQSFDRKRKIFKQRHKIYTNIYYPQTSANKEKSINASDKIFFMNIKKRIQKTRIKERIENLKRKIAKTKRQFLRQKSNLIISQKQNYINYNSVLSQDNSSHDIQSVLMEDRFDEKKFQRDYQHIKNKLNMSDNNIEEDDINNQLQRIKQLQVLYKKDQETAILQDSFQQQQKLNQKKQQKDSTNSFSNFFQGCSDSAISNKSLDERQEAKQMRERISKLLKKEFTFTYTKRQFEIDQINSQNCSLSCKF